MKKQSILIVALIFLISVIAIYEYRDLNKDNVINYLEKTDYKDVKFEKLISKCIDKSIFDSFNNYNIKEFNVDISNENKLTKVTCTINKKKKTEVKQYQILYYKKYNYIKVIESNHKVYKDRSINAKGFLKEFEMLVKEIELPEGDFDYYSIVLMGDVNLTVGNNIKYQVWENNKFVISCDDKINGIGINVSGQTNKQTNLAYYVIRKN